jgi:mono/diheme cytochrome c family protein
MAALGKHLAPLFLLVLLMQLASCEKQPSGGRSPGGKSGGELNTKSEVSYEADIQPLLKKSCISCHGGAQEPNLSTFASVKKAAKDVHVSVKEGSMPKAKKDRWSAKQVELVKLWIAGGYLKSAGSKKPTDDSPDENDEEDKETDKKPEDEEQEDESENEEQEEEKPKVTYALNIKKIIKTSCLTCHGVGGSSPELDTKEKVIAAADAVLDSVEEDRMPKSGSMKASDKALIKAWVEGGKL